MHQQHDYQHLINLFNDEFYDEFQTRLIKGDEEPIYLPADDKCAYHQILFAHGFYASALHEISHWCIAGVRRRQLIDYGYWYCADGRSDELQKAFEEVEIKPQALDWLFCTATGFPFNVSCDNLNSETQPDRDAFKRRIYDQVMQYLAMELPPRAQRFINRLHQFYGTLPCHADQFAWPT